MVLEQELETYKNKLPELVQYEGKFVLIHGTEVIDVFESYEDAIKVGYQRFALDNFLVKQVQTVEQVQFISRALLPCSAQSAD
jgi:hypothetical protein